jgi:hypothetical protein
MPSPLLGTAIAIALPFALTARGCTIGGKMGCDSVVAEAEKTWLFASSVF